jgi:hypothetical protein
LDPILPTPAELWPWLALAGLGIFHGINPAMGWLFAVALGLHRGSAADVVLALPAIALGHAAAVGVVVAVFVLGGVLVDSRLVQGLSGAGLLVWAAFHAAYGHRHRVRVGMQAGLAGLALWSFLMATAHGAGLMVLPAVIPLCLPGSGTRIAADGASGSVALAAVAVHTGAMLAVTGTIAIAVYRWVGLGILRSAWVNLDLIWTAALIATGLLLLATL